MENLIEVKDLRKLFKTPRGNLHAVDGVSFNIKKGETLGVVGESGCGKSTLGRVIVGLLDATDGQILFEGKDITFAKGRERAALRKEMQLIFQDPFSSLDPRKTIFNLIAEPLKIYHEYGSKTELRERIEMLMETVGLAPRLESAYAHELDGGRRQRVGIARALALSPKFIVCDEPVSALDVSIQAQVLNLLMDLQEQRDLTYIFITHDLSVVRHISDSILVMYLGCMVEKCDAKELFHAPLHPYTKGLLSAIPIPNIHVERKRVQLQGELTSPINPKPGCRFANRCPYAKEICTQETPVLRECMDEHYVACHFVEEINGIKCKESCT